MAGTRNFTEIGEQLDKICDNSFGAMISKASGGDTARKDIILNIWDIAKFLKDEKNSDHDKLFKLETLAADIDKKINEQIMQLGSKKSLSEKFKGIELTPEKIQERGLKKFNTDIKVKSLDHIYSKFLNEVYVQITSKTKYAKEKEAKKSVGGAGLGAGAG